MNDVYLNPEYNREIDECMDDISTLLYMNPQIAYGIIRQNVNKIVGSEKFKNAISCGSIGNCSFCCHDTIQMGIVEADIIKHNIVLKNVSFNKDRVKKQNSGAKLSWMDKACPMLLDEDSQGNRKCGIYDDRPLICRTHNSTMNPLECNKENDPKKSINEAKVAALDAFLFTGLMIGKEKPSRKEVPIMVTMSEILKDI